QHGGTSDVLTLRNFRHGFSRAAHHFRAATRVYSEKRDSELRRRTRRSRNLVRNVVKLQIEKHLRARRDDVFHDLRSSERKKLRADLEHSSDVAKLFYKRERVVGCLHVERHYQFVQFFAPEYSSTRQ